MDVDVQSPLQQTDEVAKLIFGPYGAFAVGVFLAIALAKKWIVMGWTYMDMEKDRDRWREIATSGVKLTKEAVEVAKQRRS